MRGISDIEFITQLPTRRIQLDLKKKKRNKFILWWVVEAQKLKESTGYIFALIKLTSKAGREEREHSVCRRLFMSV